MTDDAQRQLDGFIDKYTTAIAAQLRAMLPKMRALIPGATIMAYDNYNALAIGFGPTEKASRAVLSLAAFPKWVTLCFLFGVELPDPDGLLAGGGARVRHHRLAGPETLDDPRIIALIAEAVARADPPFDPTADSRLVIKSISAKQRPRQPVGS